MFFQYPSSDWFCVHFVDAADSLASSLLLKGIRSLERFIARSALFPQAFISLG
jgi:hypothetical protein